MRNKVYFLLNLIIGWIIPPVSMLAYYIFIEPNEAIQISIAGYGALLIASIILIKKLNVIMDDRPHDFIKAFYTKVALLVKLVLMMGLVYFIDVEGTDLTFWIKYTILCQLIAFIFEVLYLKDKNTP